MKKVLFVLAMLISLVASAQAAPIVTLGPPDANSFLTVDPGSIRVDLLGTGDVVDLQVSITIHPLCVAPFDVALATTGDGGTFTEQTGVVSNVCGGDTSVFDIRLTGSGLSHIYDIEFLDIESGEPLASIEVQLSPVAPPVVTLGPPVMGDFLTVDPGSIRVEMLGSGNFIDLDLSITIHPFCVRPFDLGLGTSGDGGTFVDLTGTVVNNCGNDTSEFVFRLTGDGLTHAFDLEVRDLEGGGLLIAIPVEIFPGGADSDGDGISDLIDNCLLFANTDQRDTDVDRIGNLCDPDVAAPNDCIVNFLDLNVYRTNFFLAGDLDTDNNGDGQTNFADLEIVRNFFFRPPGPSVAGCN